MSNEDWLSSREAQQRLQRTDRQLRRYAQAGRVRTRVRSGRIEYHNADIEQLASEQRPDDRPHAPDAQIIPSGELLAYVRELQQQIAEAAAREGYLRAQLETRPQLEDSQRMQVELAEERARRVSAEHELERLRGTSKRSGTLNIVAVAVIIVLLLGVIAYFVLVRA